MEILKNLDIWDYLAFLALLILAVGGVCLIVVVLGMPGKIAYARKHPDAEAINLMAWLGFLGVVPWVQAFIWAFKPADVIDIRRFPQEEKKAIDEEMAKHAEKTAPEKPRTQEGKGEQP
jgi:hypothetical protein